MRTPRVLAAALGAFACLIVAGPAVAAPDGKGSSAEIANPSQRSILKRGAVAVKVTGGDGKVELRVEAKSFDRPRFTKLTKAKRVGLDGSGSRTVKLRLTKGGRRAISACGALTLRAKGHGGKAPEVALIRDTKRCKPKPIDLSAADRCDFIGAQEGSLCMLPFPSDFYTVKDRSTATDRRLNLKTEAMPQNEAGDAIDAAPYNLNDGFSPGQTIVVKVPGLETPEAIAETSPVSLSRLGDYVKKRQPIVVIDAKTGKRWPIWVELDSNATDPARAAILIHPATNFDAGGRYIVAMRKLKNAKGRELKAPEGFRYLRDDLPTKAEAIGRQGKRYEKIFKKLRTADVKRSNLYLAWDFTIASDENIAGRVLHMRDESFAGLGDTTMTDLTVQGTSPSFAVSSVQNFTPAEDANMARRVQGTFTVPCYLAPNCDTGVPGGTFNLDSAGLPTQTGTYTANFNCMIPRRSVDTAELSRPSLYGHGLLGSANETTSSPQRTLGNSHGFVFCGTNEIGLAGDDIPLAFTVLQDMGKFPQVGDRLQQGLLNELFLGRLMIHPQGLASDPAFHQDGTLGTAPVIDSQRLYYNGNSQGGIIGGALTAIAPDFTRASLGVTGMNYSVLLNRSVDFDQYAEIAFQPSYTDELERPLVLAIVQMLWDRGEANGYAHRMTDDPLPETPPHEVLMNVAFGDHQVSTFTADTQARTIGAQVHAPIVYDGRWPIQQVFDVPRIASYPYKGSALVYWDSGPIRDDPASADPAVVVGTEPPPIANLPNRSGRDPHGFPRQTPAEQQMVSDFLRPDAQSQITDTCNGGPCFDLTFSGP